MRNAPKIAWYSILALLTMLRMVVAFPLIVVWIGADLRGDREMTDRLDRWIDRVVGNGVPYG